MKKRAITISLEAEFADWLREQAKAGHRTINAQAALFIETGISEIKRREAKLRELDLSSGQAQGLAEYMAGARP
jgi:hypothetical protein